MFDLTQCVVGVDLGDQKSRACVYSQGVIVEWFEFAMTPDGVRAAFEGKGYLRVALEAGAQSGWVTRLLRTFRYEPVVANPRKLKAISANERKSDRNDALMLAKLVWADASLLHPIHHRSEERALALSVITARDAAVTVRTRVINTIRSMAKAMGVRLKRGSAEGFVNREAESPEGLRPAVTGLFTVLRALNEQIAAYDDELARMVEETFPEAQRPKQVRGVGPVTALAFVLTLEDPKRFPDGRTAAAFLGLVPGRDQSGAIDRQLRISKTGSNLVRRLLVQCAQYILGPLGQDCDLRRWGHALALRGGKSGKKRAIVATARKLAVLMFRLWKSDDVWVPLHNAASDHVAVSDVPAPAGNVESKQDFSTLRSDEERPQPAVADDCACFLEDTGDRVPRRIDCSSADGSDPSMHRASTGPSTSADRSVGHGTVSSGAQGAERSALQQPRTRTVPVPSTPKVKPPTAVGRDKTGDASVTGSAVRSGGHRSEPAAQPAAPRKPKARELGKVAIQPTTAVPPPTREENHA